MKLYHGTNPINKDSIKKLGLIPGFRGPGGWHIKPDGTVSDTTHFTPYKKLAQCFGDLLVVVEKDVDVRRFESEPRVNGVIDRGELRITVETEMWSDEPPLKETDLEVAFPHRILPEHISFETMKDEEKKWWHLWR